MKTVNAIKKLQKAGLVITAVGNRYTAEKADCNTIIKFIAQSEDSITCIQVRRKTDQDDSQSDYFAGTWCDNITQAIKYIH